MLFQPFDLVKTRLQEPAFSSSNHEVSAKKTKHDLESGRQTGQNGRGTQPKREHGARNTATNSAFHSRTRAGGGSAGIHSSSRLKMSAVVSQVVRQDGVSGLWRGLTPSLARTVPGVGLYFGFLHSLKTGFQLDQRKLSSRESFLLGATSRLSAAGVLMPFTVIKARFESGLFHYRSVSYALVHIFKNEGVKGLWSGMIATILRDAPYSGLYLMFYNQAKDSVKLFLVKHSSAHSLPSYSSYPHSLHDSSSPPPPLLYRLLDSIPQSSVHFLCSISAGVLASAATQPPDVIKTRMQLHPGQHRSVLAAAVFILRTDGPRGFFAGFVPRTLRRTLMAAATWTLYEQLMTWMGLT